MSFSSDQRLGDTLKEFQVTYTEATFITGVEFAVSDYFRDDLQLMREDGAIDASEYAICENLVYPVLTFQSTLTVSIPVRLCNTILSINLTHPAFRTSN